MSTNKEIYQKLIEASKITHQKNLNMANYVVVNQKVANIINGVYEKIEKQKTRKKKLQQLNKISKSENNKKSEQMNKIKIISEKYNRINKKY